MLKHLVLAALLASPGSQGLGADQVPIYSVARFSKDCLVSGGVPRIFDTSAMCEQGEGRHITCLRQDNIVSACKLENVSPIKLQYGTRNVIGRPTR